MEGHPRRWAHAACYPLLRFLPALRPAPVTPPLVLCRSPDSASPTPPPAAPSPPPRAIPAIPRSLPKFERGLH